MPAPSTLLRAARPAFRSSNFFTQGRGFTRSRFGQQTKRWESTASPVLEQSFIKRMWDSPVGLKTVHFWAPVMKWCIVIAGVSDFYRPAETLSLTQNLALTATGIIWTRWCFVIKPRNILLAAVNFFLGVVGVIQVSRIVSYNYKVKNESASEQLEEAKEAVVGSAKGLKKDAIDAVKS